MLVGRNVEVELSLPSNCEIVFTCRFAWGAEQLFEAWTKPEQLRLWWGCEGSLIVSCAIDLREGGSWEIVMQMPDGSQHPFRGTYKQIIRPSRLVYTECYDMLQFGRPEWQTTVTFHPVGSGTLVTHTIRHQTQEARDKHLSAGMREGETQALSRLSALHTCGQTTETRHDEAFHSPELSR